MTATDAPPVDLTKGVFDAEPEPERLCAYEPCGKPIKGRHPSAMYHTDDCKERAYRDRKNGGRSTASPAAAAKRKSEMPVGSIAWAAIGYGIQLRLGEQIGAPVGRVMQFQAGDAGPRIERLTAKVTTALPFLKVAKGGGQLAADVAALLGPPLITALIASGRIPPAVAEPVFVAIMRPLIAEAMEQSRHQVETMQQMTDSEAELLETTREFLAAVFGAGAAEPEGETP